MRRKFKPSLRHELKVAVTAPRPEPDQEFEIVVNDGHDTVLHYEGSPLVDTSLVADPEGAALTKGENNSYESEDWICVGLATDNVEDASNELVDRGPNTGNPEDGSGGRYQPIIGSFANGLKYTQI